MSINFQLHYEKHEQEDWFKNPTGRYANPDYINRYPVTADIKFYLGAVYIFVRDWTRYLSKIARAYIKAFKKWGTLE